MGGMRNAVAQRCTYSVTRGSNVLAALAKRRDPDREHVNAKQQVFAELAFADQAWKIGVAGGDDADVGFPEPAFPEAAVLAFLQEPKQLHLTRGVERVDLVEEERAAVRFRDEAFGRELRTGERAADVSEQFVLEQGDRYRATVHRNEFSRGSRTVLVDPAGIHFLANTGGAEQEDFYVGLRRAAEFTQDALMEVTAADNAYWCRVHERFEESHASSLRRGASVYNVRRLEAEQHIHEGDGLDRDSRPPKVKTDGVALLALPCIVSATRREALADSTAELCSWVS